MKEKFPKVSLLIVNYNGGNVLKECLKSLENVDYPNFEVVLVDNGSSDDSVDLVKKFERQNTRLRPVSRRDFGGQAKYKIRLVESRSNLGFSGGNNLAFKYAKGKYIVLLNGDTEVEPDWLTQLVKFAEKTPNAGVFASKIMFFDNKNIINSAGGLCDLFGFSPLRGTFDKDVGQFDRPDMVFYAHGAAMMIRRAVVEKIGFLDEDYFIYHEELDFCWRAWIAGYKVYYVPRAVAYHKLKQRSFYASEKRAKRQFLVKKNRISTLIKNHKSLSLLIVSLIVNLIVSIGEILVYGFNKDFETPKGTFQAYIWNIKNFKKDWEKRKKVQKLYKADEKYILQRMKKFPVAIDIFKGLLSGKYSLPL